MKPIFLTLWLGLQGVLGFGQQPVPFITPKALYDQIIQRQRPAVIQFWIPSCGVAKTTVREYDSLIKYFGDRTDFYFIGNTNKPELVTDLLRETNLHTPLYIIDLLVQPTIYLRIRTFSVVFSKQTGTRVTNIITAYYNPKAQTFRFSKSLAIQVNP